MHIIFKGNPGNITSPQTQWNAPQGGESLDVTNTNDDALWKRYNISFIVDVPTDTIIPPALEAKPP